MGTFRPELHTKLESLVVRYGGDENFVIHIHNWPKTIKKLVFSSPELMVRFGLEEKDDRK